jgi:hypothetical protein
MVKLIKCIQKTWVGNWSHLDFDTGREENGREETLNGSRAKVREKNRCKNMRKSE